MKQFTTPEQTAKLIELGFTEPKYPRYELDIANEQSPSLLNVKTLKDYTIGELIEIMGYDLYSIHYKGLAWEVKSERVETSKSELVDALYAMIVKLKEEGVI